jgi:glutaredoxin-related protein
LPQKIKCPGINLTKEVKELYNKTLKKEIEETRRWEDFPCSWIGKINIVGMTILPKAVYRLNAVTMTIS